MKANKAKELAEIINKRTVEIENEIHRLIAKAILKGKMFCIPINVCSAHDDERIVKNLKAAGYHVRCKNYMTLYALGSRIYCQYEIWWSDDEFYPNEPEFYQEFDAYTIKWE